MSKAAGIRIVHTMAVTLADVRKGDWLTMAGLYWLVEGNSYGKVYMENQGREYPGAKLSRYSDRSTVTATIEELKEDGYKAVRPL